jgi:phospholipid-binding lipoprotein MlaA
VRVALIASWFTGRRTLLALWALLALGLSGCASMPEGALARGDPWERMNRQVFSFNEAVDEAAIKPTALVYQSLVPGVVRAGVNNVFANVGDAWTSANLLLQAKPRQALNMGFRMLVNSVFGLAGLFDVADEMGLERFASEDFGQTLGYWGLKSGPYLVLPLLGPSTLRDTAAILLEVKDSGASVLWTEPRDRYAASALQLLNARVKLLSAGRLLDEMALDKYVLMRDTFLARRRSLIYDGEPPDEESAPAPYKQRIK